MQSRWKVRNFIILGGTWRISIMICYIPMCETLYVFFIHVFNYCNTAIESMWQEKEQRRLYAVASRQCPMLCELYIPKPIKSPLPVWELPCQFWAVFIYMLDLGFYFLMSVLISSNHICLSLYLSLCVLPEFLNFSIILWIQFSVESTLLVIVSIVDFNSITPFEYLVNFSYATLVSFLFHPIFFLS